VAWQTAVAYPCLSLSLTQRSGHERSRAARRAMDHYEYLLVMISVVMGLGVSNLLTGVGRLLQARQAVKLYWVPLTWVVLLFLLHVQVWWSIWRWHDYPSWNFATYVYILLLPIVLYLLAFIVLPNFETDESREVDLRTYYYHKKNGLFGLACLIPILPMIEAVVFHDLSFFYAPNWFRLAFFVMLLAGVFIDDARYHETMAVIMALLFAVYIGHFSFS
jgi:hypothetical protein